MVDARSDGEILGDLVQETGSVNETGHSEPLLSLSFDRPRRYTSADILPAPGAMLVMDVIRAPELLVCTSTD